MESTPITPELLESMDAVIIVTDHSDYNFAEIVKHSNLVVDTRNATKGVKEHRERIVMA